MERATRITRSSIVREVLRCKPSTVSLETDVRVSSHGKYGDGMKGGRLIAKLARRLPKEWLVLAAPVKNRSDCLHAEERVRVVDCVAKRRDEFSTGRWLAHRGMEHLSLPPAPVGTGPRGAPIWAAGVVGSITHSGGVCVVAIARSAECTSLGCDLELCLPTSKAFRNAVLAPAEATHADSVGIAFSAKESVYKCLYQAFGMTFGFRDVRVGIDYSARTFDVEVPAAMGVEVSKLARGWFEADHEGVATLFALPRHPLR
jgi:4'-phosphopantetheinyl transferase EntD